MERDRGEWHRDYDDPGSLLSRRGELAQGHLRAGLERAPAGDVRLISLCAGQGRDVIGVLTRHPRRHDVRARLVELDERNAALARQAAQAAGWAASRSCGPTPGSPMPAQARYPPR